MSGAMTAPAAKIPRRVLDERLRMLGIDANTRANVSSLQRPLAHNIDAIVDAFYTHMMTFPEVQRIFHRAPNTRLRQRQSAHWLEMFECRFDDHYVSSALLIGRAHFENEVSPRLYLAGQNYFHCKIIELAARECAAGGGARLAVLLASISRVIALDLDLALSAYTRAYWTKQPVAEPEGESVWI